jgi:hypothetical protein
MRKTLVLAALALAVPATSAARMGGALDACHLVSSRQAASLGVTASCKGTTRPGVHGTVAFANWGSPGSTSAALALTVSTFNDTNNPVWQENLQLLKILPGHPKKVSGIGSVAYESGGDGSSLASLHFVKGKRIVAFSWYSKKPQTSLKVFNAIAKSIAAQL